MSRPSRSGSLAAVVMAAAILLTTACGPVGSESLRVTPSTAPHAYPQLTDYPNIRVTENVLYGTAGTEPLFLDVCHPEGEGSTLLAPRKAVISVHGGSWRAGDKASNNWRNVCQWLASEGFVAFSVDYRLAPVFTFPAQIEDVRTAVRWLRQPEQAERYNIDPDRIGAFGGSAGGNLVALLGLEGTGDWNAGSRVAAIVDLSGPTDLTIDGADRSGITPAFRDTQAAYLGCETLEGCEKARSASPLFYVDDTDPPCFIANSTDEFIPIGQSKDLVTELRANGVDVTFITVKGSLHSIALLDDDMKARIAGFLKLTLGAIPVAADDVAPSPGAQDATPP